ncbi:MAG: glutamate--cysteine ligase, partial [Myxococcota bacterium]|nr:glutamate--cysteine ligase [Myxococcota bacterium]
MQALAGLLRRPGFGRGPQTLGAELELALVGEDGRPCLVNREVAEGLGPHFTLELDRFDLECNLPFGPLAGRPFRRLRDALAGALEAATRAAAVHGARVAAIGILPTLEEGDLQASAMTDVPRYRALSWSIRRLRGDAFRLRIDGAEPLELVCDDVTLEGAATSLQIHLRVEPERFADVFNAVQLATPPVLAASGNSPVLVGHRLWEETRIALFKQAVDPRRPEHRTPGHPHREPRVGFGSDWVRDGALELFAANVARHEPLLPVLGPEDPLACLASGGVPELAEMRLHQGTVWSWNRAIYDPADGGHLRIEMRALPAGPTPWDMAANAAFLVGLALDLAGEAPRWTREVPFAQVRHGFYRAAQRGLAAELPWPDDEGGLRLLPAPELLRELAPRAMRGLVAAGVDAEEAQAFVGGVQARVRTGRTAAAWQRAWLAALEPAQGRRAALAAMLERYLVLSAEGRPVHDWPLPG